MAAISPRSSSAGIAELLIAADKPAVVLDIGSRWTKIGFAGEAAPRRVVSTALPQISNFGVTSDQLPAYQRRVEEFLHDIYFKCLHVSPKERRVVVCQSMFASRILMEAVARALLERLAVPAVLFAEAEALPLLPLRAATGLLIDVGHHDARVLPVCEHALVVAALSSGPHGHSVVLANLKRLLMARAPAVLMIPTTASSGDATARLESLLTNDVLQDIIVRFCWVPLPNNATSQTSVVEYPLPSGDIILLDTEVRSTAFDPVFTIDDEDSSLVTLVLGALKDSPLDVRIDLARSIVCVGGGSMCRGFTARLLHELRAEVLRPTSPFASLAPLRDRFALLPLHKPFPANTLQWTGAAVLGAVDSSKSITREFYIATRRLPDWTSLHVAASVF